MGSSPSPPKVQSAGSVAAQQNKYNQQYGTQNLVGSAANQSTPYGNLTYTFGTGPNGALQLNATQSLTPQQQTLLNQLQATQQSAGGMGAKVLQQGGYGNEPPDLTSAAGSIVDQNMQNFTSYLSPFFNQQTEQLDNQLRNQGLVPGTEGYDRAINNLRQSQGQTTSGYLAQIQPQAYNQAVTNYELPLQTAASLAQLGAPSGFGSNLANTPQANYQPVNYSGIVSQQQQLANQQYQQQVQQNSGLLSGLFGIGGSLLGGPIGGAIGSGIGGLFGGSGGGGYGNSWTPMITVG